MTTVKANYYSTLIAENKHNPRFPFATVAQLTQGNRQNGGTEISAFDFADYFDERVTTIKARNL